MKTIITVIAFFTLSSSLFAQFPSRTVLSYLDSNFVKLKAHPSITGSFKNQLVDFSAFISQSKVNYGRIQKNPKVWNDTILHKVTRFEKAITSGKMSEVFSPRLVGMAKRKYPGKSSSALLNRMKFYMQNQKR